MHSSTRGSKKVKRGGEKRVARVLGGKKKCRTSSRPWPDRRAVLDPFLGPETRLPDWYPAWQSLHRLVPTDPDPDLSIELFSGSRVLVQTGKLPSFFSVIFSIVM